MGLQDRIDVIKGIRTAERDLYSTRETSLMSKMIDGIL